MRRRDGLAAWLIVAAVPFIGGVQGRNSGNAEIGRELARSSVSSGKSFDYASGLAAMGPRLTGSAAYQRAAEWCVDRLRAVGIARTALEPFTIDRGWERVSARARIVEPESRALHVTSPE